MSDQTNTPAATEETPSSAPAIELSAAEQASVDAARRGLSEPTNVNTPPPPPGSRPDWCPEQFFKDGKVDHEGLARSYSELRAKMDAPKAEETPPATEEAPPATDAAGKIKAEETPPAAEGEPTPLEQAMTTARTEWAETQEVTEETVVALEAAGIPRDVFNLYLEGLKAQTQQAVDAIHGYAGGKDNYDAATAWAAKNLKAEEIETFNASLDDVNLRETAVAGLMARFQKAHPSEGRPLIPSDTPAAGSDVFASRDELVAAQKDPRYASDPAYRQGVVEKLARSQQGGFQAFQRPLFERQVLSRG